MRVGYSAGIWKTKKGRGDKLFVLYRSLRAEAAALHHTAGKSIVIMIISLSR